MMDLWHLSIHFPTEMTNAQVKKWQKINFLKIILFKSFFLNKDDNEIGTENNLVVLDPDHPLMERFQRALKNQLLKREQKLTLEAREVKYQLEVNLLINDQINWYYKS